MPTGNRRWQIARLALRGSLLAIVAGCGRSAAVRPPVTGQGPTTVPSVSRKALTLAAPDPTGNPPSTLGEPSRIESAPPTLAQSPSPEPTPLLDAALDRAESLRTRVAEEVARPASSGVPLTAVPSPTPPTEPPSIPDASTPAPSPSPEKPQPTLEPASEGQTETLKPKPTEPLPDLAATPEPSVEPVPAPSAATLPVGLKGPAHEIEPATPAKAPDPPSEVPEPSPAERPAGESVEPEAAASTPGDAPRFQIGQLKVCRRVRGFGDFDPWTASKIRPGQAVILYTELSGVHYDAAGDLAHSRVAASVEWIAEGEDAPRCRETLGIAEETSPLRRPDYFVGYLISVPKSIPCGTYQLRLTQTDEVGHHSDSRSIPLTIGR